MDYKTFLEAIDEEIRLFRTRIDEIEETYTQRIHKYDAKHLEVAQKFNNEALKEWEDEHTPKTSDLSEAITQAMRDSSAVIDGCWKYIENKTTEYIGGGASADFVAQITGYNALGIQLSDAEFATLSKNAKTYAERRMLFEFAKNRTDADGNKAPYNIDFESVDAINKHMTDYKQTVDFVLHHYAGQNNGLAKIIAPQQPTDGATYTDKNGEHKQMDDLEAVLKNGVEMSQCAAAIDIDIHSKTSDLLLYLDGVNRKDREEKTELTTKERALIDIAIDPKYPSLAKGKAVELANADPYLKSLLLLDDRYSETIIERT